LLQAFAEVVRASGEPEPHLRQARVILPLLEQRDSREAEPLCVVDGARSGPQPHLGGEAASERGTGRVRSTVGPLRFLVEQALRVPRGYVAHCKGDREVGVRLLDELHGTREE
jgi:hypothetical protein